MRSRFKRQAARYIHGKYARSISAKMPHSSLLTLSVLFPHTLRHSKFPISSRTPKERSIQQGKKTATKLTAVIMMCVFRFTLSVPENVVLSGLYDVIGNPLSEIATHRKRFVHIDHCSIARWAPVLRRCIAATWWTHRRRGQTASRTCKPQQFQILRLKRL